MAIRKNRAHCLLTGVLIITLLLLLSQNAMAYTGVDGPTMFGGGNGFVIGQCMFKAGGNVEFNLKTIVTAASTIKNGDFGVYYYDADYDEWYDITGDPSTPLTAGVVAALVFDEIIYTDGLPGDSPPNTTAYDAIVLSLDALVQAEYTTDSWTLYLAAIDECNLTLTADAGQTALDDEVIAIQAALDMLVEVVAYEANGTVIITDESGVKYDSDTEEFIIPSGVTEFTFTDGSVAYTATFDTDEDGWVITQDDD